MSKPKSIAEVGEFFDEKFPAIQWFNAPGQNTPFEDAEQIKQFWLEHFKSLLEEMQMEKNFELGCRRDNTCQFHYRNSTINEINKHLDNLLSKGEVK